MKYSLLWGVLNCIIKCRWLSLTVKQRQYKDGKSCTGFYIFLDLCWTSPFNFSWTCQLFVTSVSCDCAFSFLQTLWPTLGKQKSWGTTCRDDTTLGSSKKSYMKNKNNKFETNKQLQLTKKLGTKRYHFSRNKINNMQEKISCLN